MGKITVIPSTINPLTRMTNDTKEKRRVAGYARVSTDQDEQFTSYQAQIDYYTKYIKSNPDWEFVKVYTDEGISGTNTKHRLGFQNMIADAKEGKIDLIVTKSVSRFARNTVDSLVTIRELKQMGVECYFEKENIYTFDGKGELLITIMSSLAQEESRSISENVTWGKRKAFSDGKISMPFESFMGYKKGPDGKPEIVESEAKVIRFIYSSFLQGQTSCGIARNLMNRGILTPRGKKKWQKSTIDSILTNEKYKGDALLQKKFTVDFLSKKTKINEGEVSQYYVHNSHPAIISPNEWEEVQVEFERRKTLGEKYSSKSIFSSKLVCADCGSFYGRKVWHSTRTYRKYIWQCNKKFINEVKCSTPTLTEDEIMNMFIKAYNILYINKENVIEDCELMKEALVDFTDLDNKITSKLADIKIVTNVVDALVKENATKAMPQDIYIQKYNELSDKYNVLYGEYQLLVREKNERISQQKKIDIFIKNIEESDKTLEEWDGQLWNLMVEKAKVHRDKSITFMFYNGAEIKVEAE